MRILIVSATNLEVSALVGSDIKPYQPSKIYLTDNHDTDVIITGVGSVPTSYCISQYGANYDILLNLGIAGSFSNKTKVGDVVIVSEDAFCDLGIDNQGDFIPFYKSKMVFEKNNPLVNQFMLNPMINRYKGIDIPMVRGVTTNTTTGSAERIQQIKKIWDPDIETMEGAAVFYCSILLNKPFICIRSISNKVEPRNEKNWQIKMAIDNLCEYSKSFIGNLTTI